MNKTKEKNYELRVAIGLFLIIFMVTSGLKCISVMLTEINELGFSMAFIGICTSICGACAIGASLLFSKFVKKIQIKRLILLGSILSAVSYIFLATVQSMIVMVIIFIMKGFSTTFGGYTPISVLLARWYREKYAFALAIIFSSMSFGSAFWSMAYGIIQPIIGFEYTLYGLALLQLIFAVVILKFLVIEKPEDVGIVPFARETSSDSSKKGKKKKTISVLEVDPKTALKTPLCWHIMIVAFLISSGSLIIQSYLPMQAEIMGFNKTQSASTFSIIMVFGSLSSILGGMISSRKSAYYHYSFITGAFIVGWIMLITCELTYPMLMIISMLCGIAYPVVSTAVLLVLKENFGQDAYSGVIGILDASLLIGSLGMSPIAGLIYDGTGSYIQGFIVFGSMVLLGFVSMAIYPILRKKAFKKHADKVFTV